MKMSDMKKVALVSVLSLALLAQSTPSYAWGGGDRGHGGRHYYRDGRWYRHGWLGFDIAVSALVIGALVDSLPPRHTTVVVQNVPYYYYDNVYYRPYPGGYMVVQPPPFTQVVVQRPEQFPENMTVNIPNANGSYTTVTLRRSGNGFIGPQGEYYPEHPTVQQLKVLYGR